MSRFSIESIFKAIDRTSPVIAKISKNARAGVSSMAASLRVLDRQASQVVGTMNKAGLAVGAAGVAAGAGLWHVGQAGADFEEAITAVGAVSLMTRGQIADLEAKALELGATTKFTATEVANAMEIMGRAGFTNAEVLAGVGGILSAAAAEGAEMAEVTSHVSNVLKGMGLQAGEASRVADVLTLASARTNSSISSLGESMKNLSPVAKQFGISLEDSVAMVAMLQDVGLDASEAGTATATMLTKLASPTDEIAAKMRQLGIAFKDAKGNMLPPLEVFRNMQDASGKLGGNMDQVAFFADLVGLRGQKAALNLKDLFTSDKGRTLAAELANAAGSAEKMASLRMQNLKGDIEQLSSAVEGVQVALFNTESGPMRGIVKATTDWVNANQALIVSGFTEFMAGIRDNLPTIVTWLTRLGKIAATIYGVALAIKAVGLAVKFASAIAAASPLMLWVYGITAAVALLWAFWPEISAFFTGLWETIKSAAAAVWSFLTGWFKFYIGLWVAVWGPVLAAVWGFIQGVIEFFSPLFPFFQSLWGAVSSGFSLAWSAISSVVSGAYQFIVDAFQPLAEFFSGLWEGISASFQGALGWVLEKIGSLTSAAMNIVGALGEIGGAALGGEAVSGNEAAMAGNRGGASGGVQTPAERSSSNSSTDVSGTVTIASPVPAKVTRAPKGGVGLKVAHTGGF